MDQALSALTPPLQDQAAQMTLVLEHVFRNQSASQNDSRLAIAAELEEFVQKQFPGTYMIVCHGQNIISGVSDKFFSYTYVLKYPTPYSTCMRL